MPDYEYEHEEEGCDLGKTFHYEQKMSESALEKCPNCGGEVFRVMKPVGMYAPTSDSDLRDKGFLKLEKRSDGVYENLTATEGESKFFDPRKPETAPDLLKRGLD